MGRYRKLIDTDFVALTPDKKSAKCLICDKTITHHTGNIKRHYRKLHHYNFDDYHHTAPPRKKKKIKNEVSDAVAVAANDHGHAKANGTGKNNGNGNVDRRRQSARQMTASHAPFQGYDSEGSAQQPLQPWSTVYLPKPPEARHAHNPLSTPAMATATATAPIATTATSATSSATTTLSTAKEVQAVAERVERRLVSLKLDTAAAGNHLLLGISLQYLEEFELRAHTLAVVRLPQPSATADHIRVEVMKALERYRLKVGQLYAVTTDNGSHVFAAPSPTEHEGRDYEDDGGGGESTADTCDRVDRALKSILPAAPCPSHALHLAAWDVLRHLGDELQQQRRLARMVRAKLRQERLTGSASASASASLPTLDDGVLSAHAGWLSTYEMVKSLRKIRILLQSQVALPVDIDWKFLDDFHESFTPLADFAAKLRQEELIVGDFLIGWLACEIQLRELAGENRLAQMLLDATGSRRRTMLMANDAFLAGVFLDPRLCCKGSILLDEEQKRRAVKHLLKLWQTMRRLRDQRGLDEDGGCGPGPGPGAGAVQSRSGLKGLIMGDRALRQRHDVEQALATKQYCNQLPLDSNTLQYWKGMQHQHVVLGQLAEIALAMPTTQASVERVLASLPPLASLELETASRSSEGGPLEDENQEDEEADEEEEEETLLVEMGETKVNEINLIN